MSRHGVSFTAVAEVAELLRSQGEVPTIEKVRHHLGTGSSTTLSKHLNEWRLHGSAVLAASQYAKGTTPDPVKRAVEQVWHEMNDQAQQEIASLKEHFEQKINLVNEGHRVACEERDRLQLVYTEASQREREVFAEKEILAIELRRQQEENKILNERCQGLEQRANEQRVLLEEQIRNVSELHGKEMLRQEINLTEFYARQDTLLNEIKTQFQAEKNALVEENDSLRDDLKNESEQRNQQIAAINDLSEELKLRENDLDARIHELKASQLEYALKSSHQYEKHANNCIEILNNIDSLNRYIKLEFPNIETLELTRHKITSVLDELARVTRRTTAATEALILNQNTAKES